MVGRFLKYLLVSIIFALILSSVTNAKTGQLPSFKWLDLMAVFPTSYVAFKYKNLIATVVFGCSLGGLVALSSWNSWLVKKIKKQIESVDSVCFLLNSKNCLKI